MHRPVGIGVIGYAFMGRAHSHALRTLQRVAPATGPLELVTVAGRDAAGREALAKDFGYLRHVADWHSVIEDDAVDIVANLAPNDLHEEVAVAAAQAGKHVLCEKPLGRSPSESRRMLEAVRAAGVTHATAFNYRFVPAVRLAKQLIAQEAIGEVLQFRGRFLHDWALVDDRDAWRFDRERSGTGAIGDLSHIIDMARYLAGDLTAVQAMSATFVAERVRADGSRREVDVDDAYSATASFASGALGTLEATRAAHGRKGHHVFEVNGSAGSLWWDLEDLNVLHVFTEDEAISAVNGFRRVLVTEPHHPFLELWWPSGHMLGWEHTFVHQWQAFIQAVLEQRDVDASQASFVDGLAVDLIIDAIARSNATGRRVAIVTVEDFAINQRQGQMT